MDNSVIDGVVLGVDHRDTLIARIHLAHAYKAAGRFDEAIASGEAVAADAGRILGPNHPETLTARHNLAFAYYDSGQRERGLIMLKAVATRAGRVFGRDHLRVRTAHAELFEMLRELGREP